MPKAASDRPKEKLVRVYLDLPKSIDIILSDMAKREGRTKRKQAEQMLIALLREPNLNREYIRLTLQNLLQEFPLEVQGA